VCADHEVPKSVQTIVGQPHEHTRVVQIVCFQVVVLWSLRAIEGPDTADLWPNDVFTNDYSPKVANGLRISLAP
jgi:hypothetical protein